MTGVIVTHVQPGGAVIATVALADGRTFRSCGEKANRGYEVHKELYKMLQWVAVGSR